MSDTLITVVAIFLSVVLLVVLPLAVASQRVDNVSKIDVETLTSDFIEQIRTTGKLTENEYERFSQTLTSTGNTYDINMEFKILDENPGKKTTQTVRDKIGENVYYSVYTSQIKETLDNDGVYILKEGDIVSADVKNTNLTIGQQLKNFAYKVIGNNEYTISASKSGLVIGNGSADTVFIDDANQNKIKYVLREENQNGKVLTTNSWTNKNIYIEFANSSNLVSDCEYYWRYKKSTDDYENGYTKLNGNSLVMYNKNSIQAFWKSASLEKYSNIESININIDREKPVVNSVSTDNSSQNNSATIRVDATDTGGSGIYNYYYAWTEENQTASPPNVNSDGWTGNSTFIADSKYNNEKCTVWVKDRAGNISNDGKSIIVRNIIPKVERVNLNGAIIKINETARIHPTFEGGGDYKSITYDIVDSSIAEIRQEESDVIVTGKKNGKTNLKCTITNYDGTQVFATVQITVIGIEFSPNGGVYGILKNSSQSVKLDSQVQLYGEISRLEYAWGNSGQEKPNNWKTFYNGNTIETQTSTIGDYYLWIHTIDRANNSVYYTSNAFTVRYISLADINPKISFDYDVKEWTTGSVTVTASTSLQGYTLQTSKDGKQWQNTPTQTFNSNGTIYARLWNGTEYGAIAAGSVTNIDREAPTIESVQIRNLTTKGYDVYVFGANDAGSGINRIQFPTWTSANGQDDIQQNWQTSQAAKGELKTDGTTWVYHVNISDHNNEKGEYLTHIYAWDNLGNVACVDTEQINVPTVSALTSENVEFEYSTKEWTNTNVTVTAKIKNQVTGYSLQTSQDGENWENTTRQVFEKNGTMYVRFWDGNTGGTVFTTNVTNIDKDAPICDYAEVRNVTETGYDVYVYGVRDLGSGLNRVQFPTWTNNNGQDDIQPNWETNSAATGTKQSDGTTWVYHVNIADHNNERTSYATHVYLYDNLGNVVCAHADNSIRLRGAEDETIKFTFDPSGWTNKNVTARIDSKIEGIRFQTSKDGENWSDSLSQTFENNGTMYVKTISELDSSTTQIFTTNVTNIDRTKPTLNSAVLLNKNIEEQQVNYGGSKRYYLNMTINLNATDAASGVSNVKAVGKDKDGNTIFTSEATIENSNEFNDEVELSFGPVTDSPGEFYSVEKYEISVTDAAGNESGYKELITGTLADKVEIGDYVEYNATSNYSYSSPKGNGSSPSEGTAAHGSGFASAQNFTSSSSIKWRVLSKDPSTGEVVLISESPITTNIGSNYNLNGAIGYLYAEEELNKICSIYGHGRGANTNKTFDYVTGCMTSGTLTETLTGSGARSIDVNDINSITGYTPSVGGTKTNSIYYPTKYGENGYSKYASSVTTRNTDYTYKGEDYLTDTSSNIYKVLFGDNSDFNYWIASRSINNASGNSSFSVKNVNNGKIGSKGVGYGTRNGFFSNTYSNPIRPIVYLKPNVTTTGKNSNGAWVIIE